MFNFWNSKSNKITEQFTDLIEETITIIDDTLESQVLESNKNTEDLNLDKLC
jgi:hypothetical protein